MISRSAIVFLHDLGVAALAWICAYWLRFNLDIPPDFVASMFASLPFVVVVQGAIFYAFGLYRGLWRFASVPDLKRILMAGGVAALATPAVLVMTKHLVLVPRSVLLFDPILLLVVMGGVRFAYRAWKDGHFYLNRTGISQPVLVLGAGKAAATLLRELGRNHAWQVVGLLDDDPTTLGRQINGVKIYGTLDKVAEQARRAEVRHAIIAMPEATPAERRRAAELAVDAGLSVLTVPSFDDLLSGRVSISSIRNVELEDLLGRDQVQLDDEGLHRLLTNKTVLVTGAGGSIGSELCRQINRFKPRLLVFYEMSEYALYAMEQEFSRTNGSCPIACVIGDVKDQAMLEAVFARHQPDVVFHAAAYKHVPLMENENAWEAVRNNVLGTLNVARAAIAHGVVEFVMISTDKAVNPTNVMGASKRLAEMVCQAVQSQATATRFVMVRFGNVLGSSGSVIPIFNKQIAFGGPVKVTHPDVTRYFMTLPEAAGLVLQSAAQGSGGEIFVLDMGRPVKIVDLARQMIELSGLKPEEDIAIEFVGLRPGEKLFEELSYQGENISPTQHPKIMRFVSQPRSMEEVRETLTQLTREMHQAEANQLKMMLKKAVPEYQPYLS